MVASAGPAPAIFLPGIILPASPRYAPLIEAFGELMPTLARFWPEIGLARKFRD